MELNQNLILKLVVRQGTDLDRKQIILTSGELGYSSDIRRLFVGNSVTNGGDVVGNIVHSTQPTIPNNFASAIIGDLAFASDTKKLHRLKYTTATNLSSWETVGGVYSSGDSYIKLSSDNVITLGLLSANSVSNNLIDAPLILNAGRIGLSATIPFQTVSTNTVTYGNGLSATSNGVDITNTAINPLSSNIVVTSITPLISANMVSSNLIESPLVLNSGKIGLSSTIPTSYISNNTITFGSGLNAKSSIYGDLTYDPLNLLNNSIVITTNQLFAKYDGTTSTLLYSKNLSSTPVVKLSAGHYRFFYNEINDKSFDGVSSGIELFPIVNIFGSTPIGIYPRPIDISYTSCDVKMFNLSGPVSTDAIIILQISY